MITICFTYFKSLTLANLEAALFSVRYQDLSRVHSMIVVDNDTTDDHTAIQAVIDSMDFPIPVFLLTFKHGDPKKTHSWSTNVAVRCASTHWVFFSRADYILERGAIQRFTEIVDQHGPEWNGFVTGNVYHLGVDVSTCEQTSWRESPLVLQQFPGALGEYTVIDAGVWMARRDAFQSVQGLDEDLTAWGHAQTHFQYKLHAAGTEFVRIPVVLFYHPQHSAARDLMAAHAQLEAHGIDLRQLWARYEGVSPYAEVR